MNPDLPPLPLDFDAGIYLALNADVAMAVEAGDVPSAEVHFQHFGVREGRRYRLPEPTLRLGGGFVGAHTFRYPYEAYGSLPRFRFAEPRRAPSDAAIAKRVIAAWKVTEESARALGRSDTSGMWSGRMQSFSKLSHAFEVQDAETAADILAGMLQSHLTHGMAMGLSTAAVARRARNHFAAICADRVLR